MCKKRLMSRIIAFLFPDQTRIFKLEKRPGIQRIQDGGEEAVKLVSVNAANVMGASTLLRWCKEKYFDFSPIEYREN